MLKTNTSQFKAKLGKFMRAVREGKEVLVTDRDRPVARLVPVQLAGTQDLVIADPINSKPLGQLIVKGIVYQGTDSVGLLVEERGQR